MSSQDMIKKRPPNGVMIPIFGVFERAKAYNDPEKSTRPSMLQ